MIRSDEAVDLLDAASDAAASTSDPGADEPADDPVAVAVVLRDLAVLEVLYGAGLRVAECCGLRRADCDLERGLVTVVGKGSKVRRVPLGVPAVDALADWLVTRPSRARVADLAARRGVPEPTGPRALAPGRAAGRSSGIRCPTGGPSTRTHYATPTLPTCSKAVPTSEPCRSSSDTQTSPPPRSTPT